LTGVWCAEGAVNVGGLDAEGAFPQRSVVIMRCRARSVQQTSMVMWIRGLSVPLRLITGGRCTPACGGGK
jgi:hypothetical protein